MTANTSILYYGEKTDIGTRVITWNESDGFAATNYSFHRLFNNGTNWRDPIDKEELRNNMTQFIIHYDACWNSTNCFTVLENRQPDKLSVQFMLDLDGTIYQSLDLKYRAYHALADDDKANDRSIGVEIANIANRNSYKAAGDSYYLDISDDRRSELFVDAYSNTTNDKKIYPRRFDLVNGYYTDTINGSNVKTFDFTQEQYDALVKLIIGINQIFPKIKLKIPRLADHSVPTSVISNYATYQGVLGHYHCQTNKIDPGSGFDWEYLENRLCMRIPITMGQNELVTQTKIDEIYTHVEKDYASGYYPLGTNTVWHGGVHIHGSGNDVIRTYKPGKIVCARLSPHESTAVKDYGSCNFMIVEHYFEEKKYFSLYMHLGMNPLEKTDNFIKSIPWLQKEIAIVKYKPAGSSMNYRSSAIFDSSNPDSNLLGSLSSNESVEHVADVPDSTWKRIRLNNNILAYINASDIYARRFEEKRIIVDSTLLARLKTENIVKIDKDVEAGEVLWLIGECGSSGHRTNLLHWEIFSEENLFEDWTAIEDDNEDFNIDSKTIEKLISPDGSLFVASDLYSNSYTHQRVYDGVLTLAELKNFYKNNPNAGRLRSYGCKFLSEWGVDLEAAIPKMKNRFFTTGLKEKMQPYMWWDDAVSTGVELPASKHVWHYNPIRIIEFCTFSDLVPLQLKNPFLIAKAVDTYLTPTNSISIDDNLGSDGKISLGLGQDITFSTGRSAPENYSVSDQEEVLKNKMYKLLNVFAKGDSSGMTKRLFDRFLNKNNSVTVFEDQALNKAIAAHPNFIAFSDLTLAAPGTPNYDSSKTRIHQALENAQWEINKVSLIDDLGVPAFNLGDKFFRTEDFNNGLGIMINGVQYVNIYVEEYHYDNQKEHYDIKLKFVLYDVFGLDDEDLLEFGASSSFLTFSSAQGITAWWQLQHQFGYAPLITKAVIYREFNVSTAE